jgi:hypothetical protein
MADTIKPTPSTADKIAAGGYFAEGFAGIDAGYSAGKTAKLNAGLARQQGKEQFTETMNLVRSQIGEYVASSAAGGVTGQSQLDVQRGAAVKGARDASRLQFNANVEAANLNYEGKMTKIAAYTSAAKSFTKGFGAMA